MRGVRGGHGIKLTYDKEGSRYNIVIMWLSEQSLELVRVFIEARKIFLIYFSLLPDSLKI